MCIPYPTSSIKLKTDELQIRQTTQDEFNFLNFGFRR